MKQKKKTNDMENKKNPRTEKHNKKKKKFVR